MLAHIIAFVQAHAVLAAIMANILLGAIGQVFVALHKQLPSWFQPVSTVVQKIANSQPQAPSKPQS